MGDSHASNKAAPKMMLGFIVRRCAPDLVHNPTPDEFAAWANGQSQNERRYCVFGKHISHLVAKNMFSQPGRLVTVRPEVLDNCNGNVSQIPRAIVPMP